MKKKSICYALALLWAGALGTTSCNGVEEGTPPPGLTEAKDKGQGNIYLQQEPLGQAEKDSLDRLKTAYELFLKSL